MFVTALVTLALTMVNSAASQVDVSKKEKVRSNSDREILHQKRIHNIHQKTPASTSVQFILKNSLSREILIFVW